MAVDGIEDRYFVRKRYDVNGKHDDCRYFVLDPQHDPLAWEALSMYASLADAHGYANLADDLYKWLSSIKAD